MGKPYKKIKKGDSLILGMTNKLNNNKFLFFAEIDNKKSDALEMFIRYWQNNFIDYNLIIYESQRGFHIVSLNYFSKEIILRIYFDSLLNKNLDKTHIAYSILKEFATLRFSKKTKKEKMANLIYFRKGIFSYSYPHYILLKAKIKKLPDMTDLNFFIEGLQMVGYAIDKNKNETINKKSKKVI